MAHGFNPEGIWNEPHKTYSHGVVQPEGRVVHVTGQIAWDADCRIVGKDDVAAQARQCLKNIETILAEVGGVLDDVVSLTIYCTDRDQVPLISQVRNEHFTSDSPPVSIFIQAAALLDPEWLVEMAPIAVVPHERYRDPA